MDTNAPTDDGLLEARHGRIRAQRTGESSRSGTAAAAGHGALPDDAAGQRSRRRPREDAATWYATLPRTGRAATCAMCTSIIPPQVIRCRTSIAPQSPVACLECALVCAQTSNAALELADDLPFALKREVEHKWAAVVTAPAP
eukprot:4019687-Pyramimonas_sp.AAC.1